MIIETTDQYQKELQRIIDNLPQDDNIGNPFENDDMREYLEDRFPSDHVFSQTPNLKDQW